MGRGQVRFACQRCRKKRAKCDGREPCQRCEQRSDECLYDITRRESKGDLRAEIERLQQLNAEKDELLKVLSSSHDQEAYRLVIKGLEERNKFRQDIIRAAERLDTNGNPVKHGTLQEPSTMERTNVAEGEVICPYCYGRLDAIMISRSLSFNARKLSDVANSQSIPTSSHLNCPLPHHVKGDAAKLHKGSWIGSELTKTCVLQLIESLDTWDHLPFSLISKDVFLQDFDSDSTRYCSSALVTSLLALATRVIIEDNEESHFPLTACCESKSYFNDAENAAMMHGLPTNLPDVQALGMLSLYQVSCGLETEGLELAEGFALGMSKLCARNSSDGEEDARYAEVCGTSYREAGCLLRLIELATGRMSKSHSRTVQLASSVHHAEVGDGQGASNASSFSLSDHCQPQPDPQLIPAKLSQLTCWVHDLLGRQEASSARIGLRDVATVYVKCLRWYDGCFPLVNSNACSTQAAITIHMYYHFCLLSLFTPFVDHSANTDHIHPREVCTQAAESILALAQSFDRLFTLRRVSGFVPYFVAAASLYSFAMHSGGAALNATHVRIGNETSRTVKESPEGHTSTSRHAGSVSAPYVVLSAVEHARVLLTRLRATHPAVRIALDKLRNEAPYA